MTARRLIMLRHGQTEYNADSRMQGQLDTHLSAVGRAQAITAARLMGPLRPLLIVSSDLQRAYDTALVIGECTGLPVRVDPRLQETHLGHWQGLTHEQIDSTAPGARLAWRDDATRAPHGGETRVDVAKRSEPVVAELVGGEPRWPGERPESSRPVLLVAHGGLIAALTAALLRLPVANWPVLGSLGNGSWTQLTGCSDRQAAAELDRISWRLDVWNASAEVADDVR